MSSMLKLKLKKSIRRQESKQNHPTYKKLTRRVHLNNEARVDARLQINLGSSQRISKFKFNLIFKLE